MSSLSAEAAVAALCLNCGLCCNGVLFRDVELQAGDDAKRLSALGLPLTKTRRKTVFPQPCVCLNGERCRIYAERPTRCRSFECGVLKRVQDQQLTPKAALGLIAQARAKADQLRKLLRESGDSDEDLALTRRYARAAAQPLDVGDENALERHARLMSTTHDLMLLLQREFLT